MKFRLSVATQISIACALITVDALLLAHALGLVPDPRATRLQTRETVSELVSRCAADSLAHDEVAPIQDTIRRLVERNPDVLSIGVRRADGSLAASTQGHEELWSVGRRLGPGLAQLRVPVLRDGAPCADVEIRFRDLAPPGLLGLMDHPLMRLLLLAAPLTFLTCRFYLGRVLRGVEPAGDALERTGAFLDAFAEGAMILDNDGRIVLMNGGLARMLGDSSHAAIGRPAASWDWIDSRTRAAPARYPWHQTLQDGALRTDTRLDLRLPDGRCLVSSVACIPLTGADGVRRGVIVALGDLTEIGVQGGTLVGRRSVA